MGRLIQKLADGPLDVIGDVHGEREALEQLLGRLGYDEEGRHTGGRRLVFVGDLCDRGPDSPGVIRMVRALVDAGRAQCVAGNHELNLLRGDEKHGNHWFFGISNHPEFGESRAITEEEQEEILGFLRTLPLALERDDLRVVHAAWIDSAIEECRAIDAPLDLAFEQFESRLESHNEFAALEARYEHETFRLRGVLKDPTAAPQSRDIGPFDEFCQMANPVKVITSGVERATTKPFFAAGKWRFVDRVAWWREYPGTVPVLFGHYWRWWDPSMHRVFSKGEAHLFGDDPVDPTMTEDHRVFCIDFSAGAKYKQRQLQHVPPFHGRLAAMRWPEREIVYDADQPATPPAG
jgi:hypothetical protein